MTTAPKVELLAQELAKGRTPVALFAQYMEAASVVEPKLTDEELMTLRAELRARIQFAWELARVASIRARVMP